jgi:hypothetical protein
MNEKYVPAEVEAAAQAHWVRARRVPRDRGRRAAEVLRLLDAALPQRQAAHGARAQLHHQRHDGALPAHEGLQRADADGLGRLRPAGRERRHGQQRAAGAVDARQHRRHEEPDAAAGPGLRLDARGRHLRPELLQVEPVVLPEDARQGHRLQEDADRQLGPGRPDRAGQRAGGRRPRLAQRRHRREARDPGLLPGHHAVRRRAAGRRDRQHPPRLPGRLARARAPDAGALDRQERRRALRLHARHPRRVGCAHPGRPHARLHHARRHHHGRDLLRRGAGAPAGHARRGRQPGAGRLHRGRVQARAARPRPTGAEGQGRPAHRAAGEAPADRRS